MTSHHIRLHDITLHYITLCYIHLHYFTLHDITSHHTTLQHIALDYIALHSITLLHITRHHITLHYMTLQCNILHCITFHYATLHHITSRHSTFHYIACIHTYRRRHRQGEWHDGQADKQTTLSSQNLDLQESSEYLALFGFVEILLHPQLLPFLRPLGFPAVHTSMLVKRMRQWHYNSSAFDKDVGWIFCRMCECFWSVCVCVCLCVHWHVCMLLRFIYALLAAKYYSSETI